MLTRSLFVVFTLALITGAVGSGKPSSLTGWTKPSIKRMAGRHSGDAIAAGAVLLARAGFGAFTQGGDYLSHIASSVYRTSGANLRYGRKIKPMPGAWPVSHPGRKVISYYGMRGGRLHKGIDIKAPKGSPIHATSPGRVTMAEFRSGYGRVVTIRHDDGFETLYAHLDAFSVSEGQIVERGDVIGKLGASGRATTPHVHYEVHVSGRTLNPADYLPAERMVTASR